MPTELFANPATAGTQSALTTLGANQVSTSSLTFTMNAAAPVALRGAGSQFHVLIDSEIVVFDANAVSTTTWTALTRGAEGSTAATHSSGAQVWHVLTSGALTNAVANAPGAVSKLNAGTGISLSPSGGTGSVTVTNLVTSTGGSGYHSVLAGGSSTSAVQTALDACAAAGGGTIKLASGAFTLGRLTVPDHVHIDAYGATITNSLTGQQSLLAIASGIGTDIQVRGGTWVGTGNEGMGNGIFNFVAGCQDIVVEDMTVTDWGEAPLVFTDPMARIRIEGCVLTNPGLASTSSQNSININFSGTRTTAGEIIIAHNIVENSSSAAIAVVTVGAGDNGAKKIHIHDNICTGSGSAVTLSATNNSTSVTNMRSANGQYVQNGLQLEVVATGFPAGCYVNVGASGAGTLSQAFTGTTGAKTVTVYRNDSGAVVWEFDAARNQTQCLIHHNNVTAACPRVNTTAITIGANFSPVPGQIIVDSNIVNVPSTSPNNAIRVWSASNPADVAVTNNNCLNAPGITGLDAGSIDVAVRHGNRISTDPSQGKVTLSGGAATVSTAEVIDSNIRLSRVSAGGTPGHLDISAVSAGTSFGIASTSGTDTSTVFWEIVH